MTLITTGLHGTPTSGCLPQYAISDDLFCAGRITGLDITDNGGTITISSGSAYVKVEDATGVEFLVKVYNDADITLTKGSNSDIIINVPLPNVYNATNNLDYSDIASIEVVPTGTGGDFHLVLANIDASNDVSEVNNSGHYLPGCDFCMRCVDGVLQLPDVNAGNVTGTFIGDGSGITNIDLSNIPYATDSTNGVIQQATDSELEDCNENTPFAYSPKQLCDTYKNICEILPVPTITFDDVAQADITINHNLGRVPKEITLLDGIDGTIRMDGEWSDNCGTITSWARTFRTTVNDHRRISYGNDALIIHRSNDGPFNDGDWRIKSLSDTQIVLEYVIVSDGGTWTTVTHDDLHIKVCA